MAWHGLAWGAVLLLWAVWSALCWLARGILGWDGWRQGGDWAAKVPEIPVPDWVASVLGLEWVQALRRALVAWGPDLQAWFQSWPDLGAMASTLVGVAWVVGTGLLGLVGLALSAFIVLVQRARQGGARRLESAP